MAVYKALKPKDTDNDKVFLVIGPWHHGQEIEDASTLGALNLEAIRDSISGSRFFGRSSTVISKMKRPRKQQPPSLHLTPGLTTGNAYHPGRRGARAAVRFKPSHSI